MLVGIFFAQGGVKLLQWREIGGTASVRAALAASSRVGRSREEAIQDTMGSDIGENAVAGGRKISSGLCSNLVVCGKN